MDRHVLFDLDNTLIANQEKYETAKTVVAEAIYDELAPQQHTVEEIIDDVIDEEDGERYGAVGVTPTRFRDSCIDAVYTIAKEADVDASTADVQGLVDLAEDQGMRPMRSYSAADVLPGAEDALDYVAAQGDTTTILTKGHVPTQEHKLAATGLETYPYHIAASKDEDTFAAVVGDADPATVWKIGDSLRSDINPALEYGFGAIHVDADNWQAEHDDDPADDAQWMRIPDLTHLEDAYDAIEEFEATGDVTELQAVR